MNIGESVYLDFYRSVGDEVGRGNDERVGIRSWVLCWFWVWHQC